MMKLLNSNSIVGFVVGSAVCLTACLSIGSSDSEKVKDQRPVVSSVTMSPDIPSSVSFCGKDIDLTRYNMHEGFDRELSSFTYFHSTTMLLIKRANRCFPIIEPILKANGIPDDFKYLAVIESQLDPRVSSPARAVGTWQLLEGTARQYGLTITPTVDERCAVTKATEAACRYLKAAYESECKEVVKAFEKSILLHVIDEAWKENLRELDDLKHSVQNASYEQKDPLLIYKLESVNLFDTMVDKINNQTVSILMRGQIPVQEPQEVRQAAPEQRQDLSKYREQKQDLTDPNQQAAAQQDTREQQKREPIRVEKTVGRNDPCPCGSGKKYKNCHGKNA